MSDTNAEVKRTTSFEAPEGVLCSICLDAVSGDGNRSTAKLHCGHQFHLDCIGSAFNMKGRMQCPNCRKVEMGRWLYASGPPRPFPEILTEDHIIHEGQYGLNYPEIPFNIHWCPFSGLARAHPAFEALEASLPVYHNLNRPHNMFAEHGAASSVANSYVAYFRPIPPASSNTNETIEDPNFSYQWNEVSNPRVFPITAMPYHNGAHQSHLLPATNALPNITDQAPVAPVTLRSTREDFGPPTRSGSYIHPFLFGHGSRPHERSQPSQTIHYPHQPTNPLGMPAAIIPGMVRFHGRSALPLSPVPANSISDQNGSFSIFPSQGSSVQSSQEIENSLPVISARQESGWSSVHNGAGSNSNMMGNFWNGHWS